MEKELPIFAYLGVHNNPNNEENFKRFKECGFNISYYCYPWLDCPKNGSTAQEALDMADKCGIKLIIQSSTIYDDPERAATLLKDYPALYGYYIVDEPSATDMDKYNETINKIKSVDNNHAFYINLLPYYNKWVLEATKTKTYDEYLEKSKQLGWTQVSFDYYPITKSGMRNTWYDNLEKIKKLSDECKLPWWGFVLSNEHGNYPCPTFEMMSYQAYTNLAYGAQGIEYFTYQTPGEADGLIFSNGPIELDDTVTETYYMVQKLNNILNKIGTIFVGAEKYSIHHSKKCLFKSKVKLKYLPDGIKSLTLNKRNQECLTSYFENDGNRYFMIVNKSYTKSIGINIKFDNGVKFINTSTLDETNASSYYNINAGDCIIFKL